MKTETNATETEIRDCAAIDAMLPDYGDRYADAGCPFSYQCDTKDCTKRADLCDEWNLEAEGDHVICSTCNDSTNPEGTVIVAKINALVDEFLSL